MNRSMIAIAVIVVVIAVAGGAAYVILSDNNDDGSSLEGTWYLKTAEGYDDTGTYFNNTITEEITFTITEITNGMVYGKLNDSDTTTFIGSYRGTSLEFQYDPGSINSGHIHFSGTYDKSTDSIFFSAYEYGSMGDTIYNEVFVKDNKDAPAQSPVTVEQKTWTQTTKMEFNLDGTTVRTTDEDYSVTFTAVDGNVAKVEIDNKGTISTGIASLRYASSNSILGQMTCGSAGEGYKILTISDDMMTIRDRSVCTDEPQHITKRIFCTGSEPLPDVIQLSGSTWKSTLYIMDTSGNVTDGVLLNMIFTSTNHDISTYIMEGADVQGIMILSDLGDSYFASLSYTIDSNVGNMSGTVSKDLKEMKLYGLEYNTSSGNAVKSLCMEMKKDTDLTGSWYVSSSARVTDEKVITDVEKYSEKDNVLPLVIKSVFYNTFNGTFNGFAVTGGITENKVHFVASDVPFRSDTDLRTIYFEGTITGDCMLATVISENDTDFCVARETYLLSGGDGVEAGWAEIGEIARVYSDGEAFLYSASKGATDEPPVTISLVNQKNNIIIWQYDTKDGDSFNLYTVMYGGINDTTAGRGLLVNDDFTSYERIYIGETFESSEIYFEKNDALLLIRTPEAEVDVIPSSPAMIGKSFKGIECDIDVNGYGKTVFTKTLEFTDSYENVYTATTTWNGVKETWIVQLVPTTGDVYIINAYIVSNGVTSICKGTYDADAGTLTVNGSYCSGGDWYSTTIYLSEN